MIYMSIIKWVGSVRIVCEAKSELLKSLRLKGSKSMCYRVDCRTCGKYSWGGCGKHLATLYSSNDEGKHCMCRSWPGVVIPSQRTPKATEQPRQAENSPQGKGNPQNS